MAIAETEKFRSLLAQKTFGALACFGQEHSTRSPIVEGVENLEPTRTYLQEGSVIFYFNHRSTLDPIFIFKILRERLGPSIKTFGAATSYRHLDPKRADLGPIDGWTAKGVAARMGVELIPVIQHYDIDAYPPGLVAAINRRFFVNVAKMLEEPGSVFLISPEGTRNKHNPLKPSLEGIQWLLERSSKTSVQPIALLDNHLPLAIIHRPQIIIGPIYTQPEVLEFAQNNEVETKDALMILLAELLPPNYWGAYSRYY